MSNYIDVRFHFDAERDGDYTHYELTSVERTGTDIPDEAMLGIGEALGQSDRWNTGGPGAVLDAMTSSGSKNVGDYW